MCIVQSSSSSISVVIMNKRQESILTYLIGSQDYKSIKLIADHFGVSEKTIRRDLRMFECYFSESSGIIEFKRGKGIRLAASPEVISQLQQDFLCATRIDQDRRERNLLQSFFILFSATDQISIKALRNFFYISHSQLLLDLKWIEEIFSQYRVSVVVDKEGIRVRGDEKEIKDILVYLLSQYWDYGYPQENILYPVEIKKGSFVTERLITSNDLEFLERIMRLTERFSSKKLWKQDYVIISISLLVLIKQKMIFQPIKTMKDKLERELLTEVSLPAMIQSEIENEYCILQNESDLQTITNILLSTGIVNDPTFNQTNLSLSNNNQLIYNFSEDFIDAFSTITDINLRDNIAFCLRIHDHIEPMINRVLINLGIADRLLDTYAKEYHSTMNICEVICWILSKKYGLPEIPRAEVLFLMLYIQIEIIEAESRLKVGLLSNDEKSIVNLVLARLSKEFPNWEFIQYQKLSKTTFFTDSLEFVITTKGTSIDEEIPHVEVSQKLSELDLRLIKTIVFNLSSDSDKEFSKLQNIFRDLLDLGCSIVFTHESIEERFENQQSLRIEGVGKSVFNYLDKSESETRLYVQYPQRPDERFDFSFRLNNWDLLLFASKIVFLVDRTGQADLYETIKKIESHLKEINV